MGGGARQQHRRLTKRATTPYDEELAERLRVLLGDEPGVVERKLFGGVAFLIGGHLAVAASGQGGLLVRVDRERADQLLRQTAAEPMVMRGRPTRGWLRVPSEHVRTTRQLTTWVERALAHVRGLPPKSS